MTVVREGGSTSAVGVNYATSNGSGKSGTEYTPASGTLSFAAGETSKTFSVPIFDNSAIMGNKTFNLALSSVTGGASTDITAALVTIVDNESITFGTGSLKFSKASYDVTESSGNATITVLRTSGSKGTITVHYEATIGSAAPGLDFAATSGTLTFGPGEAAKNFKVPIIKDSATDSGESIYLNIGSPTNGATMGSPTTATLWVYD